MKIVQNYQNDNNTDKVSRSWIGGCEGGEDLKSKLTNKQTNNLNERTNAWKNKQTNKRTNNV